MCLTRPRRRSCVVVQSTIVSKKPDKWSTLKGSRTFFAVRSVGAAHGYSISHLRRHDSAEEDFLDELSNFVRSVRLDSEGRANGPPENRYRKQGELMPQYLVANYLPDDFDPSTVTE